MRTITNHITFAALTALFVSTTFAESRVWTDGAGKTIEGEQVNLLNNQVWLKLTNGAQLKVSLDKLSSADREWAMLNQSLQLDVEVSKNISRSNSSLGDSRRASHVQVQEETVRIDALISKKKSVAYDMELTAALYLVGENGNGYQVLGKTESKFVFKDESEHQFSSAPITVENLLGRRFGVEYSGYLLTVTDSRGEIIQQTSSTGSIDRAAETILLADVKVPLKADQAHVNGLGRSFNR